MCVALNGRAAVKTEGYGFESHHTFLFFSYFFNIYT